MPTEHYKSEESYRRSRAYTHMHGIKTHAKRVCVKSASGSERCHAVQHGKKNARKAVAKR